MKRFKNILYILGDNLENEAIVAEKVQLLARLNEAEVSVIRVEEESFIEQFGRFFSEHVEELSQVASHRHQEDLDRFLGHEGWQGITVSSHVLTGKDFIAIIKQVLKHSHDLVVKGSLLDDGVDQLAMRLIRKCPCPVWVIKNSHPGDFRKVMAAIDIAPDDEETALLNKKLVELTYSLAQRERGEAFYLHAWRLEYEMMLRGPRMNVTPEELFEIKQQIRKDRTAALNELLKNQGIRASDENVRLLEGETSEVIERMIKKLEIDVLVLGSVGRSGIPGLLIGNRAEEVLSSINCTVLTVKPDGFTSPVTL